MENELNVKKRDGSKEVFNIDKINKVLEWATEDIKNVSISDIIVHAKLNIHNNIPTKSIHKVLIQSAANLFNEENYNYQFVAGRLLNYQLRKDVWGSSQPPSFIDFINKNIKRGVYDKELLKVYTEGEVNKFQSKINHERDFDFTYAGIKQFIDKYAVQNRKTKQIYETPQFAYMLIAMTVFQNYPKEERAYYVKKLYDAISQFKINLPTPQIAGIRTPMRQYSSCCLIDVDDTMESIAASWQAVGMAVAKRFGIGINFGRIRPIGSEIRNGEVIHTGVVPFLKTFESIVKCCHQNGIRGGGATINFQFFHPEIEDILVLKNNGGTEDSRVRKLDYVIQFSKLFYQRVIDDKEITLFSPSETKDLYEAFGLPEFDALYEKYEANNDKLKFKKKIKARDLMSQFIKERTETGRIYLMNIDHVNEHGSWDIPIKQTNLCVEITHPTSPLKHIDDKEAEIGICVLSALNLVTIKDDEDLEEVCDLTVRMLDELIDYQEYFCNAAENFIKNRRSLGIGITNLAACLARNKIKYTDKEAPNFVADIVEKMQYFLLKASSDLAEKKGPCAKFSETKYAKGILPIDTYKKEVDTVVTNKLSMDWEGLRERIKKVGLRHSSLTAGMPCESSSVTQNATNGIEPIRSLLTYKGSKSSSIPILAPMYDKHKDDYTLAFEMGGNKGLIDVNAAIQKFFDMAISTNLYYRYKDYEGEKLPDMVVLKDLLYAYKMGLKNLYYMNGDVNSGTDESTCAGGACSV